MSRIMEPTSPIIVEQKFFAKEVAEPAARAHDIERSAPAVQMTGLQLQQTRARNDEENDPECRAHSRADLRVEKLRDAKPEQHCREQIRRRADQEVKNTGEDRAQRSDEILCRAGLAEKDDSMAPTKGDPAGCRKSAREKAACRHRAE